MKMKNPYAPANQLFPKKRTRLRLFCGIKYFTLKRYFKWMLNAGQFARTFSRAPLPCLCFAHATPLLRSLKDVDMQLQYHKIANLKLAAEKLDGILLRPGETLSYWKAIGRPTRRKGYLEGMVLFCGTVQRGIGGGLCQLSNLIYWMTLHTGLTVTERYRHSYDVFPDSGRTQPFGSGATCFYNYRDLMIKNETSATFQLCLRVTDTELEGQWRSSAEPYCAYEVYEKEHHITHEYWGGYTRNNVLYRKAVRPDGTVLRDDYLCENHAIMMYAPFLEAGDKEAAADE